MRGADPKCTSPMDMKMRQNTDFKISKLHIVIKKNIS